jgi:hypothetical protein
LAIARILVEIGTALFAQTFTGLLADGFHGDFQDDLFGDDGSDIQSIISIKAHLQVCVSQAQVLAFSLHHRVRPIFQLKTLMNLSDKGLQAARAGQDQISSQLSLHTNTLSP